MNPVPGTERESVAARLRELLGDLATPRIDLVAALVTGFPAKADRLLGSWCSALDRQDLEAAVLCLHTLAGTALNLGAAGLGGELRRMEEATGDGSEAGGGRTALPELADRVRAVDLILREEWAQLLRDARDGSGDD
jgi:hypothetical protein